MAQMKESTRRWRELNPDKVREYSRRSMAKYRQQRQGEFWFKELERRSAKKGLAFDLTIAFLDELFQASHCAVTGLAFSGELEDGSRQGPWAPSVDRICSKLGYTKDNVQLVCWAYNTAKAAWADDVVLTMAKALVARNG